VPEVWRTALREQTNNPRAFLGVLAQASNAKNAREMTPLERDLVDLPFDKACDRVHLALQANDFSIATTRSVEDIARRLVSRARRALAPRLDADLCRALQELAVFQQNTTPQACLDDVVALASSLGVNLADWKSGWLKRFEAIGHEARDALLNARFEALGEEAFDYYDGMAFDIATSDDFTRPVATGGRYDRLVGEISGGLRRANAIGCVVRPDRFDPDENGQP
jgi:ATP phosphoribosyltransferase regulatory subunit